MLCKNAVQNYNLIFKYAPLSNEKSFSQSSNLYLSMHLLEISIYFCVGV